MRQNQRKVLRSAIAIVCIVFTALFLSAQSYAGTNPKNPGVVEIESPANYTQVLALSDVHGMYESLVDLLKGAGIVDANLKWNAGKTVLVVLGDSIDKGDRSVDVLDLWIRLSAEASNAGGRLIHVLGNHEAELLALGKEASKSKELFKELKRREIKKKEFISETSKWGEFLRSLPVAAKIGRWLFCHSGNYPEMSWSEFTEKSRKVLQNGDYDNAFLLDDQSILEAHDWWAKPLNVRKLLERLTANGFFGVVQGHQPKAYDLKDKIAAIEKGRLIKIDNGMAPQAGSHPGSILRFKKPSEMDQNKLPAVEVITHKGKVRELSIY